MRKDGMAHDRGWQIARYGVRAPRNECHIVFSRGHPPAEIASDGTRCHDRDAQVALLCKATSKTSTLRRLGVTSS